MTAQSPTQTEDGGNEERTLQCRAQKPVVGEFHPRVHDSVGLGFAFLSGIKEAAQFFDFRF